MSSTLQIVCTSCGEETFVRREPIYDGFTKTGERHICVSCGYRYEDVADVPFRHKAASSIFNTDDLTTPIDIFKEHEKNRNCRNCRNYTVNPFTQRCGIDDRRVQATDICANFASSESETEDPSSCDTEHIERSLLPS